MPLLACVCPVLKELFRCGKRERAKKQLKLFHAQSRVRGTTASSAMLMLDITVSRWSRAGGVVVWTRPTAAFGRWHRRYG